MCEYVKDSSRTTGWKVISHNAKGKKKDDGAPITSDGMDEGASAESEGDAEPETSESMVGEWMLE